MKSLGGGDKSIKQLNNQQNLQDIGGMQPNYMEGLSPGLLSLTLSKW